MKVALFNRHLIRKIQFHRNSGVALITELASLMIFGFGMLALSSLNEKTVSSNSESLQRSYATWLINSLISRMTMNPASARKREYTPAKVNCDNRNPTTRPEADLNLLFCTGKDEGNGLVQSKPIDVMGDIEWAVTCVDSNTSDAIPCSQNSLFTIKISWDADGIGNLSERKYVQYNYYL